jgi:GAF domain-containing protein
MTSASSDVDFDDYGEFGYQLEPEYTEEELRQMEEAASAQRREIENECRTENHRTKSHRQKVTDEKS